LEQRSGESKCTLINPTLHCEAVQLFVQSCAMKKLHSAISKGFIFWFQNMRQQTSHMCITRMPCAGMQFWARRHHHETFSKLNEASLSLFLMLCQERQYRLMLCI